MMDAMADGFNYLFSQSWESLLALFWFTAIFELPRYTLMFLAVVLSARPRVVPVAGNPFNPRVSAIVIGHNEADVIERCVLALHEQSRKPDEIVVVSDGSSDAMAARARDLRKRGLINQIHATQLRGGKSAGANLGERFASGDIIVSVDCDCTFDRHALERIVEPFRDSSVGSVSGNIQVRNPDASMIAAFQAVEYLVSISLGKQANGLTDHVVCVSGAFGAFRREAIAGIGGHDAGPGEDLDLTLRLRKAGWAIRFAEDAVCYTDVPTTFGALRRQRFRWERDAVRLRYRKHLDLMNPFSPRFRLKELAHEAEFVVFNVLGAAVLPFYVLWLFINYGDLAPMILLAAQAGLVLLDLLSFIVAALVSPRVNTLPLLVAVPGYGIFNGLVMRFVRLAAYAQEWIFNASANDNYVPEKVRLLRRW